MNRIALTLQAVGSSLLVVALYLVAPPLGIGFAGVTLVAFGIAAERN